MQKKAEFCATLEEAEPHNADEDPGMWGVETIERALAEFAANHPELGLTTEVSVEGRDEIRILIQTQN